MIFPVAPHGPGDQTSPSSHPEDVTSTGRPGSASTPAREPLPRVHWDRLSEQGRRQHLDAMDDDAVRALAASMPLIEQAKGIVMGCYGCDAATAFAVLNRGSSSLNLKLRVLAATVVDAASSGSTTPGGPAASACEQVRRVLRDAPRESGDDLVADSGSSAVDGAGGGAGAGPEGRNGGRRPA